MSKKINREVKTYKHVKNPKTGRTELIEDTTVKSISYTIEELSSLIKKGVIPKELGKTQLNKIEQMREGVIKWKNFLKNNPTEKQKQEFLLSLPIPSIEEGKKQMEAQKWILDNKDYLLSILENKKTKKFKQSAQYVEEKLKYPKNKPQFNLFDILENSTKDKIKETQDLPPKFIGIKLTPPQDKMINAISKLLQKKSQSTQPKEEDYYMGNEKFKVIEINKKKLKSAVLRVKERDLMKEFLLKDNPSGRDMVYFRSIFTSLEKASFLIRYKRKKKIVKKIKKKWVTESLTDIIEDYCSMIKVLKYYSNLTSKEEEEVEKGKILVKGEYVLSLNPILTDQIEHKYVEFPLDLDYRTKIASGSHLSVSESIQRLRDYLIHEISAKRYKIEINEETLLQRLFLTKYLKKRQKKRAFDQLKKALFVSQQLGIILRYEKKAGKRGQTKYIFELNKNFE